MIYAAPSYTKFAHMSIRVFIVRLSSSCELDAKIRRRKDILEFYDAHVGRYLTLQAMLILVVMIRWWTRRPGRTAREC
jgi:hypothetical protein